jgi:FKBP-type peptidyl-prolyl cis-trans isomerase
MRRTLIIMLGSVVAALPAAIGFMGQPALSQNLPIGDSIQVRRAATPKPTTPAEPDIVVKAGSNEQLDTVKATIDDHGGYRSNRVEPGDDSAGQRSATRSVTKHRSGTDDSYKASSGRGHGSDDKTKKASTAKKTSTANKTSTAKKANTAKKTSKARQDRAEANKAAERRAKAADRAAEDKAKAADKAAEDRAKAADKAAEDRRDEASDRADDASDRADTTKVDRRHGGAVRTDDSGGHTGGEHSGSGRGGDD